MREKTVKPILEFISSTQHTITLKWKTETVTDPTEEISYHIQIEDEIYKWITKYWGFQNEATIKDLAPQQVYKIRVGIISNHRDVIWSDCITAATQLGPNWTYYMFKSIETSNSNKLQSFLAKRSNAVQAVNRYGESPLMQSARLGNTSCARLLLNEGGDPNCKMFPSLQTPLMAACFGGHKEVVELLVNHGANWKEKDICGRDALHYAISNSKPETVKMALEGGCDVNSRANCNWTPLMRAGANDEVLTELLTYGGEVQLRDENDLTCLDMARLYKHENIIMLVTKRDEEEVLQDEKNSIHDNNINK